MTLAAWDIVWKAIANILRGQVFDENFLMTIAAIGALPIFLEAWEKVSASHADTFSHAL